MADISKITIPAGTYDIKDATARSQISGKANDSEVVHTTGTETVGGTKTFSAEVKFSAGGSSDICSGVVCAFKTLRAQITNLVTHNVITGGTSSTTPITFYKYTSVNGNEPDGLVQLAKIDTDGNIYEGTTKLSSKYLTSHQDISGKVDKINITAQTTQALYPIKINAQGQITAYGSAVTTMTPSSHSHGNITNAGDITATATIASGDRLVINDESASKVTNSSITFGTDTTTFLRNDGTWATAGGGSASTITENTEFNISGTSFYIELVS